MNKQKVILSNKKGKEKERKTSLNWNRQKKKI